MHKCKSLIAILISSYVLTACYDVNGTSLLNLLYEQSKLKINNKPYLVDPLRKDQWYISGSTDNPSWQSINLTNNSYKGHGVLVAIIDNGIDISHEDLINNIGIGNYSYLTEEHDFNNANHGTACAGIIAAEEGNGLGGHGIAPASKIIGFNVLKAPAISNLADALVRKKDTVWISNNSWGDFNSWGEPLALRSLVKAALEDGTSHGRSGKGIIYVFSAGNGASVVNNLPTDNVNYSGLVNNRFTIPVCAIDEFGKRTSYSEIGATLVVCAPSKGTSGLGITTTDIMNDKGYNSETFEEDYANKNYTKHFSGTSASAPMVSGIVALLLQANPNLTWRDVKAILTESARKTDINDNDWTMNSAGLHINHKYGFGAVDADQAIKLAENWSNFGALITIEQEKTVATPIPDNNTSGIHSIIKIDQDIVIEFIDIIFDTPDHNNIGDLEVILTAPSGTKSILAEQHTELFAGSFRYNNWRFGSLRHFKEASKGNWQISVIDHAANNTGTFASWELIIYGHAK